MPPLFWPLLGGAVVVFVIAAVALLGGGGGDVASAPLPDLVVAQSKIELETGADCDYASTQLGVRVVVENVGEAGAGPFVVDVNGAQQQVPKGLAAGESTSLWFEGYGASGENAIVVDAGFDVEESDDANNRLSQRLPWPTLPPTCTPAARENPVTPTPTLAPADTSPPPTLTPAPTDTPLPPTSTPVPSLPGAGETRTRGKDDMQMVYVPAGGFPMGSTDDDGDAGSEEKPQHTVYLDAYWIDRTEVTNTQYRGCVEAGACKAPTTCGWDEEPTYDDAARAGHPVVCVDWEGADAYCGWAGARLPTEAEWEKAARGAGGRIYPWGDRFDGSKVNYCDANCEVDHKDEAADDGYARTAPVGSYPAGASPYGALDMAGNVWEWAADWYDEDYYSRSPQRNPKGPGSGESRVLRGGSWFNLSGLVRSAFRSYFVPANSLGNVGFWCAQQ